MQPEASAVAGAAQGSEGQVWCPVSELLRVRSEQIEELLSRVRSERVGEILTRAQGAAGQPASSSWEGAGVAAPRPHVPAGAELSQYGPPLRIGEVSPVQRGLPSRLPAQDGPAWDDGSSSQAAAAAQRPWQPYEAEVPVPKFCGLAALAGDGPRIDGQGPQAPAAAWDAPAPEEPLFDPAPGTAGVQQGVRFRLRHLAEGTTTLVVRNIPTRYAHVHLLQEWADQESFDFLYRPYDLEARRSMGYAFVNFVSAEAAAAFQQRWHGQYLHYHGHTRALDIAQSRVQGYAALLRHFAPRILETRNPQILPVLIRDGRRLDAKREAVAALQAA